MPLRRRYLLTRANTLRMRYVVCSVLAATFLSTGVLGNISSSVASVDYSGVDVAQSGSFDREMNSPVLANVSSANVSTSTSTPVSSLLPMPDDISGVQTADGEGVTSTQSVAKAEDLLAEEREHNIAFAKAALEAQERSEQIKVLQPEEKLIKIGNGETVAGVLQDAGVSGSDAYNVVKALSKHFDPREVRAGQAISVKFEPEGNALRFASLNMRIDPVKEVVVSLSDDNFSAEMREKDVVLEVNAVNATIKNSLYGSAAHAGIPASVVAEMIRIYSYQVDFQRDVRQGDKFEILYETYETEEGDFARYGDVLFANLLIGGKKMPVYRYESKDGAVDYYDENGQSIKKTLMRTPVDGARISSGFGMRRHPVLGYSKMHKGMDFAAALGTPVYAAGDGTIELSGRRGSFGNYIRIRHNGELQTAYAHLHKIAKGINKGVRVKQGQLIGYVGSTGRSTGPHLHYEVHVNGKAVNPRSIKLPVGQVLAKAELKKFKQHVSSIKQQYATLTEGLKFAQNNSAH